MLANFGISSAVIKESAELSSKNESHKIKNIFPSVAFITLITVLSIILIVFVCKKEIPLYYYFSIPYLLFNPLTAILDGIFVGTKDFRKMSIATIISSLLFFPFSYVLINTLEMQGMIISYSVFYTLLFIIYYIIFPHKAGVFDKELSEKILKYAFYSGLGSISYFLYTRVDILILEQYGELAAIGNYELITRIFEVFTIPVVLLAQVLAPIFIDLSVSKNNDELFRKVKFSSGIILILGFLVGFILWLIFPAIIETYYPLYNTNKFLSILVILLLTIPLKFVGVFQTAAVLTPLGYVKIVTYTTLVFGFVNVILDYFFIRHFGFIGIFYATFIVHNINIFVQYLVFINKFKKRITSVLNVKIEILSKVSTFSVLFFILEIPKKNN